MIKNKILFVLAIIFYMISAIIYAKFGLLNTDNFDKLGLFFIVFSAFGFVCHTILYVSLNKKPIIVKIYKIIMVLCIINVLVGCLLFMLY